MSLSLFHPLTQAQVAILREAQRISFHIEVAPRGNATATIIVENAAPGAACPASRLQTAVSVTDHERGPSRQLVARAHVLGTSEHWKTATALLDQGDHLELLLAVDAGNTYLRKARLHSDRICIRIHKSKGATYSIPLVNAIAPDNFARIVQR